MSKLRPGQRDRLETQFLAMAKARSDAAKELARMDADLLAIQRQLDGVEAPRMPVRDEPAGRQDAIDKVKPSHLVVMDGGTSGGSEPDAFAEPSGGGGDVDWQGRCMRITALVVGVLRGIKRPEEKTPKLAAHVALLALGVDCESMHQAAAAYGLSVERVRQRAEEVRVRFNLPKNQHNKSEMAVQSYKTTARLFNKGAA
ncbi:MAG: hypothetical protein WC054_06920 [Candidatus Nanopelagicales bacterium]